MFRRRLGDQTSTTHPPRGLFQNGIWLCDCNPRVPAERFQVKKETKNQGRWFYTCQKPNDQRCGFFLWDDDAKSRSSAVLLNTNSRSEIQQRPLQQYEPVPPRTGETPTRKKRKLPWLDNSDDSEETMPGGGDGDNANSLGAEVDDAALDELMASQERAGRVSWHLPAPETPKKNDGKVDGKSTVHNGLATPETRSRQHADTSDRTPATTPTPSRFKDALSSEHQRQSSPEHYDLTSVVAPFLTAHKTLLDHHATEELRSTLDKESMRVRGIIRGRDIARAAIQTRDEAIKNKNLRIIELEGELEGMRGLIRELRSKSGARKM